MSTRKARGQERLYHQIYIIIEWEISTRRAREA
jgi:hypothetical protein